jgi:hypothetical protein
MNVVDLPRLSIARIAAIAALVSALTVAGVLLLGGERAQAAGVVGANGQINGCFKKKGKAKGALRVVPAGKRCKKGEQRIAFNAQGPAGKDGSQGSQGPAGGAGDPGLESRITQLESILVGITNGELLGAIAAVADVNALCTQVTSLTSTLNLLNTAVGGIDLGGVIPLGLLLDIPALPAQLPAFSCP